MVEPKNRDADAHTICRATADPPRAGTRIQRSPTQTLETGFLSPDGQFDVREWRDATLVRKGSQGEARPLSILYDNGHGQPQANIGNGYERIYTIINDGTDNGTIQLKLGTGGNTSDIVPPGGRAIIATNGTDWYTIAGGGSVSGSTWRSITAATDNVFSGEKIFVDTTSNTITLTLPAAPAVGDEITFLDKADTFDSNALTINPNGKKIFGATANGTVSTEGAAFTVVFTGDTNGWKLTEK